MTETKIVFVGGGEARLHEELESVREKLSSANGSWIVLDKSGTKHQPICVNPANVAYLEPVEELEPALA